MKTICGFVTTFVAIFCIIPSGFAQKGGSSPDTALSNLVGFVTVRRPPPDPTSARMDKDILTELDTYMVIITGFDSEENGPAASHINFYKISCGNCNILRWTPPAKVAAKNASSPARYASRRLVGPVNSGAQLVTNEALKRQLMDALMVQTNTAGRLLQSHINAH